LDMVADLIEKRANIECRSDYMETPLIMAARASHQDVVNLLLKEGADVTAQPSQKSTQQTIDAMTSRA
jgi:ankyrin repeat protein